MKFLKLNKFIIISEGIKTVCRDRILHSDAWFHIVQVNYQDGHSVQLPFDSEEKAIEAFDQIADVLVKHS